MSPKKTEIKSLITEIIVEFEYCVAIQFSFYAHQQTSISVHRILAATDVVNWVNYR